MDELQKLITSMLEGQLNDADAERLNKLLETDSEARRVYIEQCQLHAHLMMDPKSQDVLKAKSLIDLELDEPVKANSREPSFMQRFTSQISIMAASVAISAIGIIIVLKYSGRQDTPVFLPAAQESSPSETYENAEFPENGSLKRPPTNFAVISPDRVDGNPVSFNRDIRPILSDNCYHCHGPDAGTRKAELRLDIEANAFSPHGEFEAPIIPGDAVNSPLYKRITSDLKSEIMPPPASHKTLSQEEKDLIRDWIDQGAKWESHWAFAKPTKSSPPVSDWGNGAIDSFVAAKHKELGLKPNVSAERATLVRRLALDLTGLPASPELSEQFVADESPNAYEALVDTLLDDPAFGEHQARYWLDAARYADTHGLHLDNYREIWPYRDWVIKAFNDNQPFDQFTVEQIAGDLLPNASFEQKLATGFNRCNPTTDEGGAIEDEYRAIYAQDRVETASTVFLGLTMGCASCHDHKFDPISQKDFYRFSAFFNNLNGPIMDGNNRDSKPVVVIPKVGIEKEWEAVSEQFESNSERLDALKESRKSHFEEWLKGENHQTPSELVAKSFAFERQKTDESEESQVLDDDTLIFELGSELEVSDKWEGVDFDRPFTLRIDYHHKNKVMKPGEEELIFSKFDGDRGIRLYLVYGDRSIPERYRLRFEMIHSLKEQNLISITTQSTRHGSLKPWEDYVVSIAYNGSGRASGFEFGTEVRTKFDDDLVVDQLSGTIQNDAKLIIGYQPDDESIIRGIYIYDEFVPLYKCMHLIREKNLVTALDKTEERSKKEIDQLEDFYFDMIDSEYAQLKESSASTETLYRYYYNQSTVSLVMEEREEDAFAHILDRGLYDKKLEKVSPEIPSPFGALSEETPRNRLGLAQWLVSSENPLTARVTVNRFWQNIFGTGLVKTSEDFGIMGENPTHPELLDWLAVDFQENGWNVKELIKQIVTSETYKQNSRITKKEHAIDPENRYLARGPRYRLDGEILRDQALFVSGALKRKLGGPPVNPYQPSGVWNAVAYSGSNTRFYYADQGEGLYRRSLYTFWKRTAPPPNMTIFDAPSRENCSVRRDRTNTPLQALTLMNDPQFVEAARLLAQRVIDSETSAEEQIASMYRLAFGSEATEKYLSILSDSFTEFESSFRQNPEHAKDFIQIGESEPLATKDVVTYASLTLVASQIMNLDSFINRN